MPFKIVSLMCILGLWTSLHGMEKNLVAEKSADENQSVVIDA